VISRDVDAEADVFRLDDRRRDALGQATATLAGVLGSAPSTDAIAQAVIIAVERTFGVSLEPGTFSDDERILASSRASEHDIVTAPRGG
jgi:hypothetical protein